MLVRLLISIGSCFICLAATAQAKIVSKSISVSESKGVYTLSLNVVLQGDYTRFVQRMMDIEHYPAMEVPNVVEAHAVVEKPNKRIVWVHNAAFPLQAKYYLDFDYAVGKKITVVNYKLIPKSGNYEAKHDFDKLCTHMIIKVNSGTPHKGVYSLQSITKLKFKPGVVDSQEITIDKLLSEAQHGLSAFAS